MVAQKRLGAIVGLAAVALPVASVALDVSAAYADARYPSNCWQNDVYAGSYQGWGVEGNCYLGNSSLLDKSGDYEAQVQRFLTDMGYNPQGVDGIYGNNTTLAMKAYQNHYGITETVNGGSSPGTTGVNTWGYIGTAYVENGCGVAFGFVYYAPGPSYPCNQASSHYLWAGTFTYNNIPISGAWEANLADTELVAMSVNGPTP